MSAIKGWVVGRLDTIAKLDGIPERVHKAVFREVFAVADDVVGWIKGSRLSGQVVKVQTDNLRSSIRKVMQSTPDSIVAVVGSNVPNKPVPYLKWLEEGTPPYTIVPKNRKALSFFWPKVGGKVVLAKVNHPGIRGRFFMRAGLMRAKALLRPRLESAVREELKSL